MGNSQPGQAGNCEKSSEGDRHLEANNCNKLNNTKRVISIRPKQNLNIKPKPDSIPFPIHKKAKQEIPSETKQNESPSQRKQEYMCAQKQD